jgi:hypothetical protein
MELYHNENRRRLHPPIRPTRSCIHAECTLSQSGRSIAREKSRLCLGCKHATSTCTHRSITQSNSDTPLCCHLIIHRMNVETIQLDHLLECHIVELSCTQNERPLTVRSPHKRYRAHTGSRGHTQRFYAQGSIHHRQSITHTNEAAKAVAAAPAPAPAPSPAAPNSTKHTHSVVQGAQTTHHKQHTQLASQHTQEDHRLTTRKLEQHKSP